MRKTQRCSTGGRGRLAEVANRGKGQPAIRVARRVDPDSEGLARAREDPLVVVLASMITGDPPDRAKTGGYSVMWGGLWTRTLTQKDLP